MLQVKPDWRTSATAIGSIVSVLLVAAGLFYTNQANRKQQDLVTQQQVADRFGAAIDQLGQEDEKGSSKLSIRLGGIYGLQRLMIDSPRDESAVVQVLSAFVRTHAERPKSLPKTVPASPADVRAAISVLGKRPHPDIRLDLTDTLLGLARSDLANLDLSDADLNSADLAYADLRNTDLNGADLYGADLNGADLNGAELRGADLSDADLYSADLNGADLLMADLEEADLNYADLNNADLRGADLLKADLSSADLRGADLLMADLEDADLRGADLSGAVLKQNQLNAAMVNEFTTLPDGLTRPAPSPTL